MDSDRIWSGFWLIIQWFCKNSWRNQGEASNLKDTFPSVQYVKYGKQKKELLTGNSVGKVEPNSPSMSSILWQKENPSHLRFANLDGFP